ncbi:MAG TPA: glucosidase [Isosphaeraceae bacterium]|nr:glucosidase [Isosphaeraceae bacterium]
MCPHPTAEHVRLSDSAARRADWKNWGPYVAERAWGTVREDYSANGDAWNHFPHDHARSRAYRWNEDGLAGYCNRFQNLCMAVALWNERDPFLKERLFGLANEEGNHGEDVKEYYYYLDGVPSHAFMRMLYKYPQVEYPYRLLVEENRRRGRASPEFELVDAIGGALAEGRYFDVYIEYAKASQEDILCKITAHNRGPDPAPLHVLPQIWFRNTWSWGYRARRPELEAAGPTVVRAFHRHLGERFWYLDIQPHAPALVFTENETNFQRLFGVPNAGPFVKDAFHDAIVGGLLDKVNPKQKGTKAAAHYSGMVAAGGSLTIRARFTNSQEGDPFGDFDAIVERRLAETDDFYRSIQPAGLGEDETRVQRQAFAGLLWTKQFYHYSVELWLDGDPAGPEPPARRKHGRNAQWRHVYNLDVLSMPDKWEYPWFAAWDTAFHCIVLARLDPEWAKRQVLLLVREWYMHPSGQLPAYEWDFGDANPPVHARAARRVYEITRELTGTADTDFLEEVFHKLLLNFTWWVNRKDPEGRNAFQGGFLGLDNIGVFDRSNPNLGEDRRLEQADGTAWMGMFCLDMLAIALELSQSRPAYESIATKFFEHFVAISHAINGFGGEIGMWDPDDGFYYDVVRVKGGEPQHLKVRSFVGLIPLFAVLAVEPGTLERLPHFRRRVEWYIRYRPMLAGNLCLMMNPGHGSRRLMALADRAKLESVLPRVLDPSQFLSEFGVRSLSRALADEPFVYNGNRVTYEPAESASPIYGGNSNWRGPIWFPVNYLLVESLRELHSYYGSTFKIELPRGTGRQATLEEVAAMVAGRLARIFLRDSSGRRPVFGGQELFHSDPHWRDHIPFYEYFHGDNGSGLGASHQSGWTSLVADLIAWRHAWATAQINSAPAKPSVFPAPASAKLGPTPGRSC